MQRLILQWVLATASTNPYLPRANFEYSEHEGKNRQMQFRFSAYRRLRRFCHTSSIIAIAILLMKPMGMVDHDLLIARRSAVRATLHPLQFAPSGLNIPIRLRPSSGFVAPSTPACLYRPTTRSQSPNPPDRFYLALARDQRVPDLPARVTLSPIFLHHQPSPLFLFH